MIGSVNRKYTCQSSRREVEAVVSRRYEEMHGRIIAHLNPIDNESTAGGILEVPGRSGENRTVLGTLASKEVVWANEISFNIHYVFGLVADIFSANVQPIISVNCEIILLGNLCSQRHTRMNL